MAESVPDPEATPIEGIRHHEDVREELQKAAPPAPRAEPKPGRSRFVGLALYGISALALGALAGALERRVLPVGPAASHRLAQIALAAALVLALLAIHRGAALLVWARVRSKVARYNLLRGLRFASMLAIFLAVASVFFANWYATAVSFGLVSLILGLALQAPITSFFAWIYILVRKPYRVGDRIRIGEATGDVIDVGYLDTTLWEFGGELLSTDHPSGRVIKFPNSQVFSTSVFNYSWPLFPYVWNEIKFQIAYESDLEFVAETMREVVEQHRGPAMVERVKTYREILADTAVDHLQVQERPTVLFRVNDMTWLDAIVRYLVDPRRAGTVKTELIRKLLERLNAAPERVMFPKANSR
jgi:small-conductance mechanosensitive channel